MRMAWARNSIDARDQSAYAGKLMPCEQCMATRWRICGTYAAITIAAPAYPNHSVLMVVPSLRLTLVFSEVQSLGNQVVDAHRSRPREEQPEENQHVQDLGQVEEVAQPVER